MSRVSITLWQGGWSGISRWLLPQYQEFHPLRQHFARSCGISGGRPSGTYVFLLLHCLVTLLQYIMGVGHSVCVNGTHIKNKVYPLGTEILDWKAALLIQFYCHFW